MKFTTMMSLLACGTLFAGGGSPRSRCPWCCRRSRMPILKQGQPDSLRTLVTPAAVIPLRFQVGRVVPALGGAVSIQAPEQARPSATMETT